MASSSFQRLSAMMAVCQRISSPNSRHWTRCAVAGSIQGLGLVALAIRKDANMSTAVRIGDFVHLKNRRLDYLDTCGRVQDETHFSQFSGTALVQTTRKPDRDHGSGTWKIVSADGKPDQDRCSTLIGFIC
jgi:hypothetical protein